MRREPCEQILIAGARVIDPASGLDVRADLLIAHGVIAPLPGPGASAAESPHPMTGAPDARPRPASSRRIDAAGMILCPGLMDIHVHLREPGSEHKETIETGCRAAAAGGFTFVACMPNTQPAIDSVPVVQHILRRAQDVGWCAVGPVAAITRGRDGRVLTDFSELKAAGAVAFSDDGTGVEDDDVMRAAFIRAREVDAVLIQHCEYRRLSAGGVMHAGEVSRKLGLPDLDPRSEEAMIERDIRLCRDIRARYHVAHISTAKAIEMVRRAKDEGLPVTAEVTPHHLLLTHEACAGGDPNTKMHPPLRTAADVEACRAGLLDGTIDCVACDHAPHTAEEKAAGFLKAPPGLVGLETALALTARAMIESGLADWPALIGWFTTGPARVLGAPPVAPRSELPKVEQLSEQSPVGQLSELARVGQISELPKVQQVCDLPSMPAAPSTAIGTTANLTLIDPKRTWTVDPGALHSKSRNTPFGGWSLRGKAVMTFRGMDMIHSSQSS